MTFVFLIFGYIIKAAVYLAVAAALIGAGLAATTRADAFEAGDRQNKWIWVGLLLLAALMVYLRVQFLSWVGLVIIGLYWFDVRPQIKNILNGNYGW